MKSESAPAKDLRVDRPHRSDWWGFLRGAFRARIQRFGSFSALRRKPGTKMLDRLVYFPRDRLLKVAFAAVDDTFVLLRSIFKRYTLPITA